MLSNFCVRTISQWSFKIAFILWGRLSILYMFKDHRYFRICIFFLLPVFFIVLLLFSSSPISKNSLNIRIEDPFVCDKYFFPCHLSFEFCNDVLCHVKILDFYEVRFSFMFSGFGDKEKPSLYVPGKIIIHHFKGNRWSVFQAPMMELHGWWFSLAPGWLWLAVSRGAATTTVSHQGGQEPCRWNGGPRRPRGHASASLLWLPHGVGPCGLTVPSCEVLALASPPSSDFAEGQTHIVSGREFQVQEWSFWPGGFLEKLPSIYMLVNQILCLETQGQEWEWFVFVFVFCCYL